MSQGGNFFGKIAGASAFFAGKAESYYEEISEPKKSGVAPPFRSQENFPGRTPPPLRDVRL
jgi:hypothetical protein